jgi:hypothetical protein
LLGAFFDMRVNHRVSKMFEAYQKVCERDEFKEMQNDDGWKDDIANYENQWTEIGVWHPEDFERLEKDMFKIPIIGEVVFSKNECVEKPSFFMEVLLDTMRYEDPRLCSRAFILLNRHLCQRVEYIKNAFQIQVLVDPESIKVFWLAIICTAELRREFKDLMTDDAQLRDTAFSVWEGTVQRLTDLCTIGAKVEWQGSAATGARKQAVHVHEGNVQLFQIMLRHLGVTEEVGRITQHAILKNVEHQKQLSKLISLVFNFLKAWCKDNRQNQSILYPRFDELMALVHSHPSAALVLRAILHNNSVLVSRMSSQTVHSILEAVKVSSLNADSVLEDIPLLLQSIIVCNDKPIRKNQLLVMKELMRAKKEVAALFLDAKGRGERVGLLQVSDSPEKALQSLKVITLHSRLLSLLADCCAGRMPETSVLARSLLHVDEVMSNILDCNCVLNYDLTIRSEVPYEELDKRKVRLVRRGYIAFLHLVYISSTESDVIIAIQNKSNRIWESDVEAIGSQLCTRTVLMIELERDIDDFLTAIAAHAEKRKELSALLSQMEDLTGARREPLRRRHAELSHLIAANAEEIAEHTEYIVRIVVPMLADYFNRFFESYFRQSVHGKEHCATATRILQLVNMVQLYLDDSDSNSCYVLIYALKKAGIELDESEAMPPFPQDDEGEDKNGSKSPAERACGPFELSVKGLPFFVQDFANHMGIKDVGRSMSKGMCDVARLLSQKVEMPRSLPSAPFREIVCKLMHCLRTDEGKHFGPPDQEMILQLVSLMVYLEDPLGSVAPPPDSVIGGFNRFLNNAGMEKEESDMRWVQTKYNALGATVTALQFISSADYSVKLAALRLMNNLLEGGNPVIQATAHAHAVADTNHNFMDAIKTVYQNVTESLNTYRKLLKRQRRRLETWEKTDRAPTLSKADKAESIQRKAKELERTPSAADSHVENSFKRSQSKRRLSVEVGAELLASQGAGGREHEDEQMEQMVQIFNVVFAILRMLQGFVEGHYAPLQHYLRAQPLQQASFDVISATVRLLESFQPVATILLEDSPDDRLTEQVCSILMQAVDTLSELVQGPCSENQAAVIRSSFVVIMNRLFASLTYCPPPERSSGGNLQRLRIKLKLLTLLQSAVESHRGDHLLQMIRDTIDLKQFTDELEQLCAMLTFPDVGAFDGVRVTAKRPSHWEMDGYSDLLSTFHLPVEADDAARADAKAIAAQDEQKHEAYELLKQEAYDIYTFLRLLQTSVDPSGRIEAIWRRHPFVAALFQASTRSIEVVHDGLLQTVVFRVPDECLLLLQNHSLKHNVERIMYDVPRDNPRIKSLQFLKRCKQLCMELRVMRNVQQNKWTAWIERHQGTIEGLPFNLSCVMSVIIFLFYGQPSTPWDDGSGYVSTRDPWILGPLGSLAGSVARRYNWGAYIGISVLAYVHVAASVVYAAGQIVRKSFQLAAMHQQASAVPMQMWGADRRSRAEMCEGRALQQIGCGTG